MLREILSSAQPTKKRGVERLSRSISSRRKPCTTRPPAGSGRCSTPESSPAGMPSGARRSPLFGRGDPGWMSRQLTQRTQRTQRRQKGNRTAQGCRLSLLTSVFLRVLCVLRALRVNCRFIPLTSSQRDADLERARVAVFGFLRGGELDEQEVAASPRGHPTGAVGDGLLVDAVPAVAGIARAAGCPLGGLYGARACTVSVRVSSKKNCEVNS